MRCDVVQYGLMYDMIWYDMMWCDIIWYDVIWYGMVWYMIWYDMIWYDMIYDMIYNMTWYDVWYMMRCDVMWYDIWYDIIYHICNNEIIKCIIKHYRIQSYGGIRFFTTFICILEVTAEKHKKLHIIRVREDRDTWASWVSNHDESWRNLSAVGPQTSPYTMLNFI